MKWYVGILLIILIWGGMLVPSICCFFAHAYLLGSLWTFYVFYDFIKTVFRISSNKKRVVLHHEIHETVLNLHDDFLETDRIIRETLAAQEAQKIKKPTHDWITEGF